MNYKPFTFEKNYDERLKDFTEILNPTLKTSAIKATWSACVDLIVDPIGWQAIWKISRNLCLDLKIYFPCSVIVYVEQVNPAELSCFVSIREVEDESIQLPETMADVPLIELYPIEEQDNSSALNTQSTAELLDKLRFFYKHIWMPWDLELEYDDDSDWVENHLKPRLQLHFSLAEHKWPYVVGYEVRQLVKQGRRVEEQLEDLASDMEDDSESDSRRLQLTELYNSLVTLKNKYKIYESSRLLKARMEKRTIAEKNQELSQGCVEVNLYCVLSHLTRDRFSTLSDKIQQYFPHDKSGVRMFTSLQDALVMVPVGANIWLTQGEHPIYDLAVLESGGTITGVEEGVVITDDSEGSRTLDLQRGSLNLSSLTVKMTPNVNIIQVRPDTKCSLQDVRMEGSPTIDGIEVFPMASLNAVSCHFVNFFTAIMCNAQASLHLVNCTFSNNKVALELNKGCSLTMVNCTIAGSEQFGVLLAVPRPIGENRTSIDLINRVEGMQESGTICRENAEDLHLLSNVWNVQSLDNKLT